MRNDRRRVAAAAAAFAVALAGAAIAGVVASAQTRVPTVTVTLKEFRIVPSAKLHAGTVRLVVVNRGRIPHALSVAGPGVHAKTRVLAPRKSATLTVTLKNGIARLWCPLGNHAALGMKLTERVGAGSTATPAAPAPAPAPATTSGGGYDSTAGSEWG